MAEEPNETELQREVEEIKAAASRIWEERVRDQIIEDIKKKAGSLGVVAIRRFKIESVLKHSFQTGFYYGGEYVDEQQRKDKQ